MKDIREIHASQPAIITHSSEGVTVTPMGSECPPSKLGSAFCRLAEMERLPILQDIKCGFTGYLDKTEPEDMSANAMRGVDHFGRKFLALKLTDGEDTWVEVIHQRYASSSNVWVGAGGMRVFNGRLNEDDCLNASILLMEAELETQVWLSKD